jgi:NADH-quinone oxidoreductase subunit E
MISETEKQEIESVFKEYRFRQAACIEALKIIQKRRGWVSDEDIKDVSEFLEMTPDELDSVATFYSLIFRREVGRHIILICDSASCWVMGYEKILDHIKTRIGAALGETSADGRFTLLPVACIGVCEQAPAMIIDGEVYGFLDEEKIDRILSSYK